MFLQPGHGDSHTLSVLTSDLGAPPQVQVYEVGTVPDDDPEASVVHCGAVCQVYVLQQ